MIIKWITYIKDLLPISIRQVRLIELIYSLLSPLETMHNEMNSFIDKSRLYASCTWQVCWLEYLLKNELSSDEIEITEANGLPFDFKVSGVNYNDRDKARGLINRFKMAGKSYYIEYGDLVAAIQWNDPICEKSESLEYLANWNNSICVKEAKYALYLSVTGINPGTVSQNPDGLHYEGDIVTITANDNAPDGYFHRWEILNGSTWETYSVEYETTVTITNENLYMRAYYSDQA